ncbi:MAG: carbon storage regulator [Planctomycetota bacterium]|nr:carbon storage regulator [Planctomycetota bacterium]
MLVLSRKAGESIKIGDEITVVINRIAGNRVTLALNAPRNLRIIRGELKPFDDIEDVDSAETSLVNTPISVSIETADEPITRLRHRAH